MKANDIIQVRGIPFIVKRVYELTDDFMKEHGLHQKTRFTAYSYITNREIDAAVIK